MRNAFKRIIPVLVVAFAFAIACPLPALAASEAGGSAAPVAAPADSTDFPLSTDGLSQQSGGLFVSAPLADYGFFPPEGESRYALTEAQTAERDAALKDSLFKPDPTREAQQLIFV